MAAGSIAGWGLGGWGDAVAGTPAVSADAAAELQGQVRGTVVLRGTPLYEMWRQSMIWNYRKFRR
jgi:hypothetical protein